MSKNPQYVFGTESFTSKKAVRIRAREIRDKYEEQTIIPENTADYCFVEDLLLNHVEAEQKIGVGVEVLYVANAPDHPSTCFWIKRVDGSTTDFGVSECLNDLYQINRMSLRELVKDKIEEYRKLRLGDSLSFVSDYSKMTFPAKEAVVDHDPPFDQLIMRFFSDRPENPRSELLTYSCDASSIPKWRSKELPVAFRAFHANTTFRLVQWRENISQIKRIHNKQYLKK